LIPVTGEGFMELFAFNRTTAGGRFSILDL
jgi:hypothetical protein